MVDDEKNFLEQAKLFLQRVNKSIQLKTCRYPEKALTELRNNNYDCIVSDYQMPNLNGIELLEKVKEDLDYDLPFIIFTGKGREKVAMEALNSGAERYLRKGQDPKSQYGVLAQAIVQEVEHKEAQNKIQSLAKYPAENPHPVLRIGKGGEVIYSNEAGRNLLSKWGIERGEIIPQRWQGLLEEVFKSRKDIKKEIKVGELFYDVSISPVVDEDYANLYASDITERKEAEQELQKIYSSVENSISGFALTDLEGYLEFTNSKLSDMFGYEEGEMIGEPVTKFVVNEKHLKKVLESVGKDGWQGEMAVERKDGSKFKILSNISPLKDEKDRHIGYANTVIDITQRKEKQKELSETFNAIQEIAFLLDEDHNILLANDKAEEFFGKSKEELENWKCYELAHGTDKPVKGCPLEDTLESEEAEELEFYDEDSEKYFLARTYPINRGRNKKRRYVHQVIDITDRKKAEEREEFLNSLLRHDVGNKAQIVKGYLELLEDYDLPEEADEYLEKAEKATREGREIIEKVSTLQEAEKEGIEKLAIDPIIEDVVDESKDRAVDKGMKIITNYPDLKCNIMGGQLLKELFKNLFINSIQHSKGSKIRISGEDTEEECIVSIEDDGKGIPDEKKDEIFDRGYTTDDERGTGLGMFLVKTLLERYDGDIKVKDSDLGGARFDIYLKKA